MKLFMEWIDIAHTFHCESPHRTPTPKCILNGQRGDSTSKRSFFYLLFGGAFECRQLHGPRGLKILRRSRPAEKPDRKTKTNRRYLFYYFIPLRTLDYHWRYSTCHHSTILRKLLNIIYRLRRARATVGAVLSCARADRSWGRPRSNWGVPQATAGCQPVAVATAVAAPEAAVGMPDFTIFRRCISRKNRDESVESESQETLPMRVASSRNSNPTSNNNRFFNENNKNNVSKSSLLQIQIRVFSSRPM